MTDTQPAGTPAADPERSTVFGHEGEDPAVVAATHRLVEQAKRGEWAAAYRDAADHANQHSVPAIRSFAHFLADRADTIESGTLAPWADTSEPSAAGPCGTWVPELGPCIASHPCPVHDQPSTAPAQPPHTAPAAAGGHPGTLDGPGVLGRALVDRDGDLWQPAEEHQGREVLLVDPALIDLLRQWRDGYIDGDGLEYTEVRRALAAAVDAYDRPTTGDHDECRAAFQFGGGGAPAVCTLPAGHSGVHHDHDRCTSWPSLRAGPRRAEPTQAERDEALREALREDAEMDALLRDEEDAEPAPEQPDRVPGWAYAYTVTQGGTNGSLWLACDWCGSTAWSPPVRVGMDLEQLSIAARNHQRVCARKSRAEPAPEPAGDQLCQAIVVLDPQLTPDPVACGQPRPCAWHDAPEPAGDGPGWQRATIGEIGKVVHGVGVNLAPEKAAQVIALLADRDQWRQAALASGARRIRQEAFDSAMAEVGRLVEERDAARAEQDRLAGQREKLSATIAAFPDAHNAANIAHARMQRDAARAELAEVRRQLAATERTRDEIARTATAAQRRLAEVKVERERLQSWLAESNRKAVELRTGLATARRDAAADALDEAARRIRRIWTESVDPEQCARYFDALARATRAGTRPVPGSPEPASEAERCPCGCNPNGEPTFHVTLPYPCPCGAEHGTYADAHRAHQHDSPGSPEPAPSDQPLQAVRDKDGLPVPGPQVWAGDRWVQTVQVTMESGEGDGS